MKQTNVCEKDIKKARVEAYLDFPISIVTVGGAMPSEEGLKLSSRILLERLIMKLRNLKLQNFIKDKKYFSMISFSLINNLWM